MGQPLLFWILSRKSGLGTCDDCAGSGQQPTGAVVSIDLENIGLIMLSLVQKSRRTPDLASIEPKYARLGKRLRMGPFLSNMDIWNERRMYQIDARPRERPIKRFLHTSYS